MSGWQHYQADYQQLRSKLPGQSAGWLQQLRADAFASFCATGFPSVQAEQWRYTDISGIEKKLFSPQPASSTEQIDPAWLADFCLADAYTVVLIDGHFSQQHSLLDELPAAVTVLSMPDALEQQPQLLEQYLAQAVASDTHGLVAFNAAWFSHGVLVRVAAKHVLDKPIQLVQIVTQADCLVANRNLVLVEAMAQAEVIEVFAGTSNAYLTASVTEVFVAKNAQLSLYKMQSEGEQAYHFGGTYVQQASDSRFKHYNFALGGLVARNDVHADLASAAFCELNGLYLGSKRQHIDNHTIINHLQPHAVSRELYKGVLSQRARGVFQGLVRVAKDAQKTDSVMHNRNLLLSDNAEADAKPQLEIYADDVQCAHGVTVGQLQQNAVFYLKSRGIDEAEARNILAFAFVTEMLDQVPLKGLRALLRKQVLRQFPQPTLASG